MKIVLIIIGVIVAIAGAGCALGGGALAVIAGSDGWIDTGTHRFDTSTRALVSESAEIEDADPGISAFGDVRVRIRARSADPEREVFIGIARSADVERYLAGVEHDVITDIEFGDFNLDKRLEAGSRTPGEPAGETFWSAWQSGPGQQEVDWEVEDGEYRAVIMNADASRGIDVRGSFGVKIPYALAIGIGLAAAGLIVLAIGVLIIVLAARSATKPRAAPPPAPDAPPAAAGPPLAPEPPPAVAEPPPPDA